MLRPLPRLVPPFRNETITSYLHRLAGGNRIDPAGLRYLLARSDRKDAPVPLGRLAAITGLPCQSLAWAMPQICTAGELSSLHLRDRPRARPGWAFLACRACVAGQPVIRWALHDDVVCSRHRRWISRYHEQPDLTRQPEILHAYQRHRRLIRRHGRDPVMRAFRDAQHICIGWRLNGLPDPGFDHRMEIFSAPAGTTATNGRPTPGTSPPTRSPSRWPACSPARTGANESSARAGPGTTNSPPNYAAPWPPTTRGTTARPPVGAATEKTRCSNGDCTPAASHSSRSRRATTGTCPKPSSRQHSRRPWTMKTTEIRPWRARFNETTGTGLVSSNLVRAGQNPEWRPDSLRSDSWSADNAKVP